MTRLRLLFIITCMANIAFAFGSLPWVPNPMTVQYSSDGIPAMPPFVLAGFMGVVTIMVAVITLGFSWLMTQDFPTESFCIPNRDYWTSEENRPETVRRLRALIEFLGTIAMLFALFIQWETFRVEAAIPPGGDLSMGCCCALAVLIILTIGSFVHLLWIFRLPKSEKSERFPSAKN